MSSLKKLRVTVDGRAFDVTVELLDEAGAAPVRPTPVAASATVPADPADAVPAPRPAAGAGAVPSPLAGKVVSIDVKPGQAVAAGAQLLTLEAMKMNTLVYAPHAGTVGTIHVHPGDVVEEGAALVTLA
jgi:glutaconyl-CoA/methylmalonyl-CoA decarboxylase subunit gamma